MMRLCRSYSLCFILIAGIMACRIEITPITPPQWPLESAVPTGCQPPPIEKNIVGTWRFESTLTVDLSIKTGQITFKAKGKMNDPDLLFANPFGSEPVLSKTYNASIDSPNPTIPGKLFVVYQTAKGTSQGTYYSVISNECNRIHINSLGSVYDEGFILTR